MKTKIKVALISAAGLVLATILGTILGWLDPNKNDPGLKDSGNKDYSETMDTLSRVSSQVGSSEQMMQQVWEAYNNAKASKNIAEYKNAIDKADNLIDDFEPRAITTQKNLLQDNEPIPKPGKNKEQERQRIWSFWPLHEVSAAWWVKGRCYEANGDTTNAVNAYEKASQFPHALVFDPDGDSFWSPAKDAKVRKKALSESLN